MFLVLVPLKLLYVIGKEYTTTVLALKKAR
jgi:hypothetical protein